MLKIFISSVSCLVLLCVISLQPCKCQTGVTDQKDKASKKGFSLFDSNDILNVSIQFDLTGYLRKTKKDDSFDGVMVIHTGENDSIDKNVKIKYRGEFRYENCSFPPMQINFKKPVNAYSDTGRIKKLKLVTRCNSANIYDEYILREYLVYKLYNVLSDTSFRVRLIRITFNDTRKNRKPLIQYGFFIEPIEILAGRINAVVVSSARLDQIHIVPDVMDRVAIFNYMIANWDWSVPGQHNLNVLKTMSLEGSSLGLAVPYDFDLCGIVNAGYFTPGEAAGVKSARDRKYAGICRTREEFKKDLAGFLNKKEELYSVINDFEYINQKSKEDITSFLDQFFTQFEKGRGLDILVNEFLYNCK